MGLLKFFARIGAVGGTARLVAKQYLRYRQLHPEKSETPDYVIYRLIIMDRYNVLPKPKHEKILLENAPNIKGLAELVKEILVLEAGFADNDRDGQVVFMEVICEELKKKGVRAADIFAETKST